MDKKSLISMFVSIAIGLIAWLMPTDAFGIQNLTVLEQRVIAIFLFAAAMWITEPVPIWSTSVLVMVLMLLTVSNSSLTFLAPEKGETLYNGFVYGEPINYKDIMGAFADPTIMLFMGGFVLAIAAAKYKMDAGLAKAMLKPFGTDSRFVLLGFILVTAIFSMFMSNTATAAMMLTILSPVLASLPADGKGRIGLALAIPIAANVGGIGSPIGTPPNAIAMGYLEKAGYEIPFGTWMALMVPIMLIILAFAWFVLVKMFPFKQKTIVVEVPGNFEKSPKAYIVYVTFIVTILLWIFGKDLFGINANVVALIPFGVFAMTGVINKKDLQSIDWDVLWLVAGGFAIGIGLDETGLGKDLVASIPLATWPTIIMMIGSGVLCITMSTFMSNTGTAALLIPILAAAGMGMKDQLAEYGGIPALLIGIAFAASMAMSLPISTPPNALAYAKGFIKQKDMAIAGILVGIFGMIVGYTAFILFGSLL
ncbi:MAG TPA: SLC13 family permease [Paludibacteraceae bacterium]|nr:SLC13 family permease [Paludibacteraceae bacterium]HQF50095.1 SLC13 family permease [Paludibacteraceae bacterium]